MPPDDSDTLIDLFYKISNSSRKDAIVLQDLDRQWTLGELDKITDELAKYFISKFNTKKGSCIAIYMNKCAEYVISYIAALKAGGAYLPLDISYPENLLNSVLEEVQPTVVCTLSTFASKLPSSVPIFDFSSKTWLKDISINSDTIELPKDITPDDLAYIVYSSGTTGKPKGIACPHRGAVLSYKFRFTHYPYESDDVVACNVFFVWELLRPILQGIKMTIIPDDIIYDPLALCQFLKKYNVTRMLFTPSLLETVLDTQSDEIIQKSFKKFRVIWLCGEVVTCALLNRAMKYLSHTKIVNLYSISECHDVSVENLTEFHKRGEDRKYCPVGKLIPGVKLLILDTNLRKVPIGVPGEIYVAGPTLARGYLNRPELNKNRFLDVPNDYKTEMGIRMYRTGDWGYLLANSNLEICGRCDTLVKIRGYSVEIQAIESTLLKLPYIASCAVQSIGAEGEDKQLAAYIVLNQNISRKTIRADLKQRLPFYMVPNFFVFMEKLPVLAASSKIDRKALPSVDLDKDVVEAEALAQTETEIKLAKIWAEILQQKTLDIQESFFDLGGHSLMAARLLAKVTSEFGVDLTMRDLFSSPTVYAMARVLDGADRKSPDQNVDLDYEVTTHDIKDNVMDLHLRAFWRSTEYGNRFFRSTILLTGVTGYLGSHLLSRLLTSSQARIVCIVRESSCESVNSRVENTLKKHGLLTRTVKDQLSERVRSIAADVALFQFGLSDEHYHFLTYDIDVVIHAAAYVNLIYPYHALHGINVLGTRNVLDFCHTNKVKPLHYISTDAVIPAGLKEIDEDFPVEHVKEKLQDGYGQSKYVAEQLVKLSQQRGLPSIIYRLGNQAASTTAGYWNDQDFTYLLLQSVIHTGKTPDIDWIVEITPVDFAAKFIVELTTNAFCPNVGKIFHLINSSGSPKWSDLMEWLRRFGYQIQKIDVESWIQLIINSQETALQQLQKLVQVMVQDVSFFLRQTTHFRTNTNKFLNDNKWKYPLIDERLFKHWLQLLVERHVISRPKISTGTSLLEKVCIITGASEGIGEAIARVLAIDGGSSVVLASRQIDKLNSLAQRLQAAGCSEQNIFAHQCDVTNRDETQNLVQKTLERFGRIDVLVNCAGLMYYTLMKNGQHDEWSKQIDVNCHGTTNMIGAVLPHMIENKRGHILNITSDAGKRGFAGLAVYSGTKFFIEGFTQALRQEMIEYNIRITNIQPGDVATKLAGRSTDQEARMKFDGSNAGHKILDPEDIAKTVLFALSQPPHVALNEILIEPQAAPI
jgi:amino acid adenylation domain-containing protein/thioester reductase-like protein